LAEVAEGVNYINGVKVREAEKEIAA